MGEHNEPRLPCLPSRIRLLSTHRRKWRSWLSVTDLRVRVRVRVRVSVRVSVRVRVPDPAPKEAPKETPPYQVPSLRLAFLRLLFSPRVVSGAFLPPRFRLDPRPLHPVVLCCRRSSASRFFLSSAQPRLPSLSASSSAPWWSRNTMDAKRTNMDGQPDRTPQEKNVCGQDSRGKERMWTGKTLNSAENVI